MVPTVTPYHPLNTLLTDEHLYHWSPRERRKGIERRGLVPGSRSLQGNWKPPYVAFSLNPTQAWRLVSVRTDLVYPLWDLWSVAVYDLPHYEMLFDHYLDSNRQFIYEVRVYERLFKRNVNWVAERRIYV